MCFSNVNKNQMPDSAQTRALPSTEAEALVVRGRGEKGGVG